MPYNGNMRKRAQEIFGKDLDTLIPELLPVFKTPALIAGQLGVYPNAVRHWLVENGYCYEDGSWVLCGEKVQANHAS